MRRKHARNYTILDKQWLSLTGALGIRGIHIKPVTFCVGRITAAMEFHAKLVSPNATQPGTWLCDNKVQSLGKPSQTWEIAFNHFANRRGLTNLTHTAALIDVVRPTNVALFMVDESLSHAASF
eukprot:m.179438 g.179438  ORF g.179438 m.179438 type:complete len:124 (-) comp18392_c0_seq7:144-515(-)